MVVALVVAAAVVVMSQKSCSGDGTFTVRNDVHDASRNALALWKLVVTQGTYCTDRPTKECWGCGDDTDGDDDDDDDSS